MIIVIDGYNFLKSITGQNFINDSVMQSWLKRFLTYTKLRRNRVVLVFDSGAVLQSESVTIGQLQVIYAGQGKSADDYLKKWLEHKWSEDLLLVTSDREIRDWASGNNVHSMCSFDFYRLFSDAVDSQSVGGVSGDSTLYKTKRDELGDDMLDVLMEQASESLGGRSEKIDHDQVARVRNQHKSSRADKTIMKKINKI